MNREYAYNRDNGKCKCCKTPLFLDNKKYCYHIKGELPLEKVNKVQNLIWLCNSCYRMVNNCKLRLNGTPVPLLRNGYSIFNGTKYR